MIKEFAGMTLEDAVIETVLIFYKYQKTGTLAGIMRKCYNDPNMNTPKSINLGGAFDHAIALNPDDFETDVDGYVALLGILLNAGK